MVRAAEQDSPAVVQHQGGIPVLPFCFLLEVGGYSLLPASLGAVVVSYQRPVVMHSFPNPPSIQQSLCAVPPPLLTVQGLLLLPADLCVFLEPSSAKHVSAEVQLSIGDSSR